MCLQFPSSQLSSVVVFCPATDHNNTAAQYQNTDCFCQHSMDHQYPGWWQLSSLQSDVMWRWLPSGTNMVTACKQCHVSRVVTRTLGHWDTPPAYLHISPHISTYLHVSAVSAAVSLSPVSTQIRRHLTRHCSHRGDTEHCSTALQNFYYNGTIEY